MVVWTETFASRNQRIRRVVRLPGTDLWRFLLPCVRALRNEPTERLERSDTLVVRTDAGLEAKRDALDLIFAVAVNVHEGVLPGSDRAAIVCPARADVTLEQLVAAAAFFGQFCRPDENVAVRGRAPFGAEHGAFLEAGWSLILAPPPPEAIDSPELDGKHIANTTLRLVQPWRDPIRGVELARLRALEPGELEGLFSRWRSTTEGDWTLRLDVPLRLIHASLLTVSEWVSQIGTWEAACDTEAIARAVGELDAPGFQHRLLELSLLEEIVGAGWEAARRFAQHAQLPATIREQLVGLTGREKRMSGV